MRDYSKISPALWQSARFNDLPSDDGRYLYLYLLTSSHQTSAGCYQLPDGYSCSDLRWPLARCSTTAARRRPASATGAGSFPHRISFKLDMMVFLVSAKTAASLPSVHGMCFISFS